MFVREDLVWIKDLRMCERFWIRAGQNDCVYGDGHGWPPNVGLRVNSGKPKQVVSPFRHFGVPPRPWWIFNICIRTVGNGHIFYMYTLPAQHKWRGGLISPAAHCTIGSGAVIIQWFWMIWEWFPIAIDHGPEGWLWLLQQILNSWVSDP